MPPESSYDSRAIGLEPLPQKSPSLPPSTKWAPYDSEWWRKTPPLTTPSYPVPEPVPLGDEYASGGEPVPVAEVFGNSVCVCEPVTRAIPPPSTVRQPARPTFALAPESEARRALTEALPQVRPQTIAISAGDHPGTSAAGELEAPLRFFKEAAGAPSSGGREDTTDTSDKPCPPGRLPCLNPDALLGTPRRPWTVFKGGPDSIPVEDPRGRGGQPGTPPQCEEEVRPWQEIYDKVQELASPVAPERSAAEFAKNKANRIAAAKQLADWARDYPGSSQTIVDMVRRFKLDKQDDNPEVLRMKKWAEDMDLMLSDKLSIQAEAGETGPVLGDLALLLAVDPSALGAGRQTAAQARFDSALAKASLEDIRAAILRIRERLHKLRTPDPKGPGKDPRKICLRGEITSFDADLLKSRMKQLIKAAVDKVFDGAIQARVLMPKDDLKRFPLTFQDLQNAGTGKRLGTFTDLVDAANGRYEDSMHEGHIAEMLDKYEDSGLYPGDWNPEFPEERLNQERAQDWLRMLQRMQKDYSEK